jgi:hypothetical protein
MESRITPAKSRKTVENLFMESSQDAASTLTRAAFLK